MESTENVWYKGGEANCGSQMKITSFITTMVTCLIFYKCIQLNGQRSTGFFSRFLIIIGDYSFGIYLCHIAVMMVLGKISFYQRLPYIVNSVVVLLISFLCCLIGDKICKNIRIDKMNLSELIGLK